MFIAHASAAAIDFSHCCGVGWWPTAVGPSIEMAQKFNGARVGFFFWMVSRTSDNGSDPETYTAMLGLSGTATARNIRWRLPSVAAVAIVSFLAGFFVSPFSSPLLTFRPAGAESRSGNSSQGREHTFSADVFQFPAECGKDREPRSVRAFLLEKLFDGQSPFQDFPPPYARSWLQDKRIKGWGSRGSVFERLIKEVRPAIILELGTFTGASAIHMANLSRTHLHTQPLILCVDDFRGWPGLRNKFRVYQDHGNIALLFQFMQNAVATGVADVVLPLPFSTGAALEALCEWGIYADLVEVDAGHDFQSAWVDINRGYAVLKREGGVMFGHDYFRKMDRMGVRRAVDLFARRKRLRVEVDGEHWILRSRTE